MSPVGVFVQTVAAKTETKASPLVNGFRNELELLERHVRMLQFVEKHGPIGIIRLSTLMSVPKHKVRYSLRILEKEGFIQPSTQGAIATEKVAQFFEQIQAMMGDVKKKLDTIADSLHKAR